MIGTILAMAMLVAAPDGPGGGGDGDCEPHLTEEGEGTLYSPPDDQVVGWYTAANCCSGTKYSFLIENLGTETSIYRVTAKQSCEGGGSSTQVALMTGINPGGFDILTFSPPDDNCGCTYTLNVEVQSGRTWARVLDHGTESVEVVLDCVGSCVGGQP